MSQRLAHLLSIKINLIRWSVVPVGVYMMNSGILMESMSQMLVLSIDCRRMYRGIQRIKLRLFVEVGPNRRQTFHLEGHLRKMFDDADPHSALLLERDEEVVAIENRHSSTGSELARISQKALHNYRRFKSRREGFAVV